MLNQHQRNIIDSVYCSIACVSLICSFLTLYVIRALRTKNGYLLLIASLALAQIVYDINFIQAPIPGYTNCVIWNVLDVFGALSTAIWSNIISYVVLFVIVHIKSFNIIPNYHYLFILATVFPFIIAILVIFVIEHVENDQDDSRQHGLFAYCEFNQSILATSIREIFYWVRIVSILFNFFMFIFIFIRTKYMVQFVQSQTNWAMQESMARVTVEQNPHSVRFPTFSFLRATPPSSLTSSIIPFAGSSFLRSNPALVDTDWENRHRYPSTSAVLAPASLQSHQERDVGTGSSSTPSFNSQPNTQPYGHVSHELNAAGSQSYSASSLAVTSVNSLRIMAMNQTQVNTTTTSAMAGRSVNQCQAIVTLVQRMKYYPIAQMICLSGTAWNMFGDFQYSNFYSALIAAATSACAGMFYFLIFLMMQPRAKSILSDLFMSLCGCKSQSARSASINIDQDFQNSRAHVSSPLSDSGIGTSTGLGSSLGIGSTSGTSSNAASSRNQMRSNITSHSSDSLARNQYVRSHSVDALSRSTSRMISLQETNRNVNLVSLKLGDEDEDEDDLVYRIDYPEDENTSSIKLSTSERFSQELSSISQSHSTNSVSISNPIQSSESQASSSSAQV